MNIIDVIENANELEQDLRRRYKRVRDYYVEKCKEYGIYNIGISYVDNFIPDEIFDLNDCDFDVGDINNNFIEIGNSYNNDYINRKFVSISIDFLRDDVYKSAIDQEVKGRYENYIKNKELENKRKGIEQKNQEEEEKEQLKNLLEKYGYPNE